MGGVGAGCAGAAVALVHVGPRAKEALENRGLVRIDHGVVGALDVVVVVRVTLVGSGGRVGVEALDANLSERSEVVAKVLDLVAVPVDGATRPVDSALRVGVGTTGPNGDLHTRRGLGVRPLVGGRIPGLRAFLGATDLAVDDPLNLIGSPVDLVVVELFV